MKYTTKQRQVIVDTIKNNPIHPTAEQVYSIIHEISPKISLGTVYRNLNLLAKQGDILKICVPENPDRFDGNTHKHYHLVCNKCGNIYDIDIEHMPNIEKCALKQNAFIVEDYQLMINGICRNCQTLLQ